MKFFSKIYLILTLDCEQSAKLTSDSLDRPLDWSERWAARLHRMVCAKSRKLNKQILQMDQKLNASANVANTGLSDSAKQRILSRLDRTA